MQAGLGSGHWGLGMPVDMYSGYGRTVNRILYIATRTGSCLHRSR
eukprot:SAG31_NODE_46741_length_253_cov_0.668831_1_plen_44_part_01